MARFGPRAWGIQAHPEVDADVVRHRAVTEREADDLVRDADRFLAVVEQALGLTPHAAAPQLCVLPEPVRRIRAG